MSPEAATGDGATAGRDSSTGPEGSGYTGSGHEGGSESIPVDTESRVVFNRFRLVFGNGKSRSRDARKRATTEPGSSAAFGVGRDAHGLGDVLDALTARLGWNSSLAQSDLLASWAAIAGQDTADHSQPVSIEEGVLLVKCDSTAWATQLRLMRSQLLTKIITEYPDAAIVAVRFDGPGAPSWKRGLRSIPGRGPRDTYG